MFAGDHTQVAPVPAHEVQRIQASLVEHLRRAGVRLPSAAINTVADAVLADAVGIALAWLEIS
jgi:hypothetical protein